MFRRFHGLNRPSLGTVLGGSALFVALGGVAVASIPNAGGTVDGCYATAGGALRVIDARYIAGQSG